MPATSTPAIQLESPAKTFLSLLHLGVDIRTFEFIDAPGGESALRALEELKDLACIRTAADGKIELTQGGIFVSMVDLPVHQAVALLRTEEPGEEKLECGIELLQIFAMLSVETPLTITNDESPVPASVAAWGDFLLPVGEHLMLLSAFRQFEQRHEEECLGKCDGNHSQQSALREWCHKTGLSFNIMLTVQERYEELVSDIRQYKNIPLKSLPDPISEEGAVIIGKALLRGYFTKLAMHAHERFHPDQYVSFPVGCPALLNAWNPSAKFIRGYELDQFELVMYDEFRVHVTEATFSTASAPATKALTLVLVARASFEMHRIAGEDTRLLVFNHEFVAAQPIQAGIDNRQHPVQQSSSANDQEPTI